MVRPENVKKNGAKRRKKYSGNNFFGCDPKSTDSKSKTDKQIYETQKLLYSGGNNQQRDNL